MKNYSAKDISQFNKRDKRISWLSIFSSLNTNHSLPNASSPKDLARIAYELNDELNERYPQEEPEPFPDHPTGKWSEAVVKPCPRCNAQMKFIEPGVSKKTGKPYNAFWSCPSCKQTSN